MLQKASSTALVRRAVRREKTAVRHGIAHRPAHAPHLAVYLLNKPVRLLNLATHEIPQKLARPG